MTTTNSTVQPESSPDAVSGLASSSQAPAARAPAAPLLSLRILGLLCIGLPLLVYAVVGYVRYEQIVGETSVRLSRALRIAQEHAQKVFDTNEAVIGRVMDALGEDDYAAIRARERALHLRLANLSRTRPQIDSIWVLDEQGRPLVSDRAFPAPATLEPKEKGFLEWHRDGRGGVYLSGASDQAETDGDAFDMSIGRYLAGGHFAGTVSTRTPPSYFEAVHADLVADEPGLAITMLRDDGLILSRWPPLSGAPHRLAPDSPVMSLIRTGRTSGDTVGTSSVDGRRRLLNFSKVGAYPVYVGTGMDLSEVRKRWSREMAWLAAFGLPPLLGLYLVARLALRRTPEALESAGRLNEEMVARRRVEESLLQSQKLEALGRLTGGVAHDFNNALMVIANNLFLLKRLNPDVDGERLGAIERAVSSATKLTRQLLAFSRRQALVPQRLRLQERLPTFRALLEPLLGSQVRLSVEAMPDTRPIHVDPAELELAIINLAVNARDALPAGGNFDIRASNATGPLPAPLVAPMVMVEARDDGAGIDPAILDKVFEPFFTTKPTGGGTGLGLSQVYGLCQRAGGLATIESCPGAGTVVRLFFPAAEELRDMGRTVPAARLQHLGKAVVLVEDNDEVAAALAPVLEALGCTVTRLDRGDAAAQWLLRQSTLPDLLLSDVVMPGDMDGLALARFARERFPGLRIILMSGYSEQLEAISRHGFELIPKPCSAEMLAAAIAR
jgi:signal transduction histidine kinase